MAERATVVFLALWGVQGPLVAAEAFFFTTYSGEAAQLVSTATSAIALAVLLAALFPPRVVDRRLLSELRAWLATRPAVSWLWRVLLAGFLYLPTYWVFGLLAYAITRPYYENTSLGLGLRAAPVEVIVPLEIVRGLLFVLVLAPLVALLPKERRSLVGWLWLVLALLVGWEPLLTATFLPAVVRFVHGTEISADAFVQALVIAVLLGSRARGPSSTVKITPSPLVSTARHSAGSGR